ncbi:MAG: Mu transposase C-terminal domain-containing protein [Ferrovibrio sp.]|uniref:Mu transposase C-terminal domain-containing protein n=1 Tax=Ferrovibrio sp. TaxID=1917215 RepID=UPI00260DF481|nr:Mu transposase C-terminal domain-containing protein [Ferrovibrio sp.]MCW0234745.1 Mu transposase C-terminal domain-containing protein [Ferrovibrio sp.]
MTSINFSRNELLEIEGEQFKVFSRTPLGALNLEHVTGGFMVTKTDEELAKLWREGDLIRVPDNKEGTMSDKERQVLMADFSSLPDKTKAAAERRMHYVRAVMLANPLFHTSEALDPIIFRVAAEIGDTVVPTARRVSEWVKLYGRNGTPDQSNIRWLAPRYHLRGNSQSRFCREVVDLTWDIIDREFLRRKPESAKEVHSMIETAVEKMRVDDIHPIYRTKDGKALLYPSLVTLRRWLKSIDKEVVTRTQRGPVEAKRLHEPVLRGPQGDRPLGEVEIDHHLLDIILIDDERNMVLGRPWLTLGLDRYTREISGYHIGFHAPSAYTVGLCIKHICTPKDGEGDENGEAKAPWPVFGVPDTIIVDNGAEFDSAQFNGGCYALGIDVVRAPVRTPQYKGKVERLFGTVAMDVVQKIPGYVHANVIKRGDYKAEEEAVCTLSDFLAAFDLWVRKIYRVREHRGIGMSPAEKWEEATKKYSVRLPSDVSQLNLLLTLTAMRALTRKGIEYRGLVYNSKDPEFRKMINRPDKPAKVNIRIDIDDMSSIVVEDWRDGTTHVVPSIDPDYTNGLRLEMHEILTNQAKLKRKAHQRVTVRQLQQAREEFRESVREMKRKKKLAKRLLSAMGEEAAKSGNQGMPIVHKTEEAPVELPLSANTAPVPPAAVNDDTDLSVVAAKLGLKTAA